MHECKYDNVLGRIEAKLEAMHEDIGELKIDMREIRGRVRYLEGKSLLMGALGAGLSITAAKLKAVIELLK
ncbi:hypothetical protein [Thermodesulforhabdus norvegica]|uniref:Uncharacterized protein n=1 Tax=Thermodesulforhabdus norvegica TaxID=39841 RepID=A0A1I4SUG1_9BACT|nr:hypothetical protein [Thermodesulforhabdus norvegica]SFM68126.1 hypothetical protein SAMN05660836_01172 [Thermodesulforhabdus norvegica]